MRPPRNAAVRIAAIFGGVSALWILFSDAAVNALPISVATQLQTVKGLLFVMVTTGTLFYLVKRYSIAVDAAIDRAQTSEQTLSNLIETAPVGVVRLDSDDVVTFVNPEAVGLLGLVSSEVVGTRFDALLHDRIGGGELREWLASDTSDGVIVEGDDRVGQRALMARATRVADSTGESTILAFSDVTDSHASASRLERLVALHEYLLAATDAASRATRVDELVSDQVALAVSAGGFSGAVGFVLACDDRTVQHFSDATSFDGNIDFDPSAIVWSPRLTGADRQRVVVFNDIESDVLNPIMSIASGRGARSAAVIAFFRGATPGGALIILSKGVGDFDSDTVTLLGALATSAQLAFGELDCLELDGDSTGQMSPDPFSALPLPGYIIDRSTFEFLSVNEEAVRRYGYGSEDFAGLTMLDVGPHEQAARLRLTLENTDDTRVRIGRWMQVTAAGEHFSAMLYVTPHIHEGRPALLVVVAEGE